MGGVDVLLVAWMFLFALVVVGVIDADVLLVASMFLFALAVVDFIDALARRDER